MPRGDHKHLSMAYGLVVPPLARREAKLDLFWGRLYPT